MGSESLAFWNTSIPGVLTPQSAVAIGGESLEISGLLQKPVDDVWFDWFVVTVKTRMSSFILMVFGQRRIK
jgi:hypothetical protein